MQGLALCIGVKWLRARQAVGAIGGEPRLEHGPATLPRA